MTKTRAMDIVLRPAVTIFGVFLFVAALGLGTARPACAAVQAEIFARPDAEGTVDVATPHLARTLVVLLSGDGGWWGDLDAQVANRLASAGYAVVGVDTQIWFAELRSPEQVAEHLSDLIASTMRKTGARRFVLAGYSFGADMVAPAFARMHAPLRREAAAFVLLSPGRVASFQVTVLEQTGIAAGAYALAADFMRLPKERTLCISGQDEQADSGCSDPALAGAIKVLLPGGHHYDHDTEALAGRILDVLKSKAPA